MIEVMDEKETYLERFAELEKTHFAGGPQWLHSIRTAAMDRFAEFGFPTVRDEEWRFTNIAPLLRQPFRHADSFEVSVDALERIVPDAGPCHRLVFVNGRFAPQLSSRLPLPQGVIAGDLASAIHAHSEAIREHLTRSVPHEQHAFVTLNTAFIDDGAYISLPRGQVLREPIHLVFVATADGEPAVCHPRNLIVADVNTQATIVESYVGVDGTTTFTNAVTEVVAAENAVIDHYKVQRENLTSFHVASMNVRLGRGGNFSSQNIVLGGRSVRNDVNAYLGAEGSECTLNGLYVGSGQQLIDNHTRIDHAKPHCASHELYKGILDGQARGVFNGKIYVHVDAQKTDAKQTNKTLLLSDEAVIDTKPQLEIFADDVKCTHGATIGQLAAEAIFYLRSRGIRHADARSLLMFAFANDIVDRIKIEPLREQLARVFFAGRPAREAQ
jgi:Fe-S cluster assembly protein SufD